MKRDESITKNNIILFLIKNYLTKKGTKKLVAQLQKSTKKKSKEHSRETVPTHLERSPNDSNEIVSD